jgi:hypothetical protein
LARSVVAPDGSRWRVRRLWLPRLRRRPRLGSLDHVDGALIGSGTDDLAGLVLGALAVVVVAVLGLFVLSYLLLLLEAVVLPLVLVAKIVLHRPFTVQATDEHGDRRTWPVVGWRASGEAVDEAARAIEQGRDPLLYRA